MIDVIHVEDEPVLRTLMAGMMGMRDDITFHQFSAMEPAFEFAQTMEGPFLLLTDMNLPEPQGGELISRVRGLPQGGDVHAVVLSASHDLDTVWSLAPEADEVIEKPTSVDRLKVTLDDLIGRASRRVLGASA